MPLTLKFASTLSRRRIALKKSFTRPLSTTGLDSNPDLRFTQSHVPNNLARGHSQVAHSIAQKDLRVSQGTDSIFVTWRDNSTDQFPFVWLKDNCQCPQCYHSSADARALLMNDLDVNIKPSEVYADSTDKVKVIWEDGHESVYQEKWLRDRSFKPEAIEKWKNSVLGSPPCLWKADYEIKRHNFDQLVQSDEYLLDYLQDLEQFGLTVIENVPCRKGGMTKLIDKIAFSRITHYGKTFEVVVKNDCNNLAYTANSLGLHTDLPYYKYNPGVQFLHFIEQYSLDGGDNQFADGFEVAEYMRKNHPEDFKILTETPLPFYDSGTDEELDYQFHKVYSIPTIALGRHGTPKRVSFSNQSRDTYLPVPVEQVIPIYNALKLFNNLCYAERNLVKIKMKAGECVSFDNQRVLHGRKGYTIEEAGGGRALEGQYIDWDEIKSRINTLKFKRS